MIYILQGYYCGEWEDLVEYDNYKECLDDYKSYQENEIGTPHRIIKRKARK